ncbi:LysM peptidoglycan-binding domain-containing protein [Dyadobacter aurulentus]|uniref:LysM peptidoglycan-binding domain-containing protein n=1 Tax=Dyadobacter sp. UC 10 TaxID=2605428 RepID=UPI0011F0DFF5|nr:LysM peptidoglycan-binding domain-containing protein [Dyadobacter sp. UC 10]KAA0989238.1 LysM peptidoglycan-binding domain-containing protein [Dyadobacter sp. UC 10]
MLNIAQVVKYKVKDGDTLESLANSHGMTWRELAKYNFGTVDPDEINELLHSQVGCIKKTKDNKKFIFTGEDKPGIIYIPKNLSQRTFEPNDAYTLVVEQLHKKKLIPSKVMVYFRPTSDWDGKFGFDWLRVNGDVIRDEIGYEWPIDGGYDVQKPGSTGLTKEQAFAAFKAEYTTIETDFVDKPEYSVPYLNLFRMAVQGLESAYTTIETDFVYKPEYFVPYLNLFPMGVEGLEAAPCTAELQIGIGIKDEEPSNIELEYDRNLFYIDKDILNDKAVSGKRASKDGSIKITCIHPFSTEQKIDVLAYPKTWQEGDPIPLAGRIIVCPNNDIKEIKLVLIKVKTKITYRTRIGSFDDIELARLKNTLFQALVVAHLEHYQEVKKERYLIDQVIDYVFSLDVDCLDLTEDPNFKVINDSPGKFIDPKSFWLNEDYPNKKYVDPEMFEYLRRAFAAKKGADKYAGYFLVFSFDEKTFDGAIGQIEVKNEVFLKNAVLFAARTPYTLAHEVLHGLGLRHTHKEADDEVPFEKFCPDQQAKYTFKYKTTDNVMSYSRNAFTTWRWQWKILQENSVKRE